ncbi:pirin family protein [Xanthomonas campestris pv. raphani]|uniref:pirin family protein n=1 Tax=Xanthomonas campestris TaxID=339 RepID=UPI002B2271D7|nr:pirin family protein [Xanthomonas campestris]MEA9912485.1 pirin family protein [Xanthomonas campestris pv. raphani]
MLTVRKSETRGRAEHGWLSSRHTFSFASYHDPRHMGIGPLRVINEDKVKAGEGFGTHAHRDMEIISYVLDGALEHKDSMGTGSVLHYGDVQRMSAGSGVTHSEFNHSASDPVHFLQIWVMPERNGIEPSYEEKHFDADSKRNTLRLIASPDVDGGSLKLHQDARLYATILDGEGRLQHPLAQGRLGYVQVARGSLTVNGQVLSAGDALQVTGEPEIVLADARDAEVLVFDLPQ